MASTAPPADRGEAPLPGEGVADAGQGEPAPNLAPDPAAPHAPSAFADVKQLGLFAAIGSLGYVFWVVGAMEMIERFAYYGVVTVRGLYGTAPAASGGLGVPFEQLRWIFSVWALLQSFVPVLTGGLSDRYGYKETIFASTVVKIAGYLVMAFFPTYGGFFAGAVLLATGTAIFKPGLQGTLVKATKRENSSMAWGIFYQTVNIGGFLGPILAGHMRKLAWRNVFLACAGLICVNFILLLVYKEPGKEERLARRAAARGELDEKGAREESLARASLRELRRPHVFLYILVFSSFWFSFMSLYDVLPNHIQDWVDTRPLVTALFGGAEPGFLADKLIVLSADRTEILPEGLVNIDAGMIMVTCFLFAALSGKMRAITSMLLGTGLMTLALALFGATSLGAGIAFGILVFSVGEMLAAPKFSEFIGNFAPADKKAMYLGFSQMPLAIGWTLEGLVGLTLYGRYGAKERFARQMLVEQGMPEGKLAAIPEGKAFDELVQILHQDRFAVTRELYRLHHGEVAIVWYVMAATLLASALGIYAYGRWIARREPHG